MPILSKLRLPYREDNLFGALLLIAFLVPLAFDTQAFEGFEIIKFGILSLFLGLAGLVFIKNQVSNSSSITLRMNKVFVVVLGLFLSWALVSALIAQDRNFSFFGFYPRFTNSFIFYFEWGLLLLLLASINLKQLWVLLKILFFCAFFTSVWGMLQSVGIGYYGGASFEFFSRAAPSFLGNPNFSSMFVAAFLPLGLYFFYKSEIFWKKVGYGLILFLQIWSLVLFASRGSLLAMVAGLLGCLFLSAVVKRSIFNKFNLYCSLALLLSVILAWTFLNLSRPGAVAPTISLKETNIQTRFSVWEMALNSVWERPVFGYGLGNFELLFEQNRDAASVNKGFFDDPHNLLLYLASTGGVPFLLLFLFLVLSPVFVTLREAIINRGQNGLQTVALASAVGAWLVAAFFTPVPIPCYVALAFFVSGLAKEEKLYSLKYPKVFKIGGTVVFGALILYALGFILAEHIFFLSIKAYNEQKFTKAYKLAQAAIYLNPTNSLYYGYRAGGAIRAHLPEEKVEKSISTLTGFHKNRAYTYIQLAHLNYLRFFESRDEKYVATIFENLHKAIAKDPYSAGNYFILGQYEIVFGNQDKSIDAIQKGLELYPENVEARMFLAKIYQLQNNKEMLIKTLWGAYQYHGDKMAIANLIRHAQSISDLRQLPFNVGLEVGKID